MIEITVVEHIVDIPEYALVFESQCSNHAEKQWLTRVSVSIVPGHTLI